MQEYLTEAVVLDKMPHKDADRRYALFTKKFGKFVARAVSARKITSKLAPHLEPGNVVQARMIEKNGLQVVDALKILRLPISISSLESLSLLLPESEPDQRIWAALVTGKFDWTRMLGILGWDPREAECQACGKSPVAFAVRTQEFFCSDHALKIGGNGVVYI